MYRIGNLNSITVNNLNLKDDVVRWDHPNGNIVRAEKQFKSISIEQLFCYAGCTIQGVDIYEWIGKGVLTTLNYTIQGTVYVNNGAISFIEVLGNVNQDTFNSNTILLKGLHQQINHVVTIGGFKDHVTPLTFNQIYVNSINGQNFTAFHENLIKRDSNGINANILSHMQFTEPIVFNSLVSSNRLSSTHHVNADEFRAISNELDEINEKIISHQNFKHFNRMVVRQILASDKFQHLSQLNYQNEFVTWNGTNILFYIWNKTSNALEPNLDGKKTI